MTPPSAGGIAGVLDVLRRDLAHATRFRCSAEGSAAMSLAECGRYGRESEQAIRTVEAMAEALEQLRAAHINHRGNYPLPHSPDYAAMQAADAALRAFHGSGPATGGGKVEGTDVRDGYKHTVHELLTNIKRSCIRGRSAAQTASNMIATCDHIENMADEALGYFDATPAGGGASGADEGDIEAIAAEVELLFANPGNDGGDARRLADRIRRLASAGSARGIPWWELAREAADVLEAVGTSGVPLPDNWRWPLADELSGAAALASRTGSAPAPSGWRPDYHTLRCWLFGIGVVGQIDGHEVIRRDSVVSLLERWLAAPTQEPSHAD